MSKPTDSKKTKIITVFAPAKINLFLHLTGKLSNGYHTLDSLVSFADIGDHISIEPAKSFSFHVTGEFAESFNNDEKASCIDGGNLVIKAARGLSQIVDKALNVKITLTKNLPLASGIGGGSSDAAATIWGLQEFWGLAHDANYMPSLTKKLGADVPVCLYCRPSLMRGIGDEITPAPEMPEIPILLINPLVSCSTADIFLHHNGDFKKDISLPDKFSSANDLVKTLESLDNDLFNPSIKLVPEISNIMNALSTQQKCIFSRMSGSGATCFGLFETMKDAQQSAENIAKDNPDWWIKTGWLNRPERY